MNSGMHTSRNWRRWAAIGLYLSVLTFAFALRGDDPIALALYRVTLPWSAFSYGATSPALGWSIIVAGAILNAVLVYLVGCALDQRAADGGTAA